MNIDDLTKIPHKCAVNLQAVYDNLKTAEKSAVDFLLEHPVEVSTMTVADFSGKAGCSEATIVRLSKRIGYKGYPELKRDFLAFAKGKSVDEYDNINSSDSPVEVLNKVFESSINALKDTMNILNTDSFTEAALLLARADRIAFSGLGDAGIVATEAQQRFARIGIHTYFSPDPDTQLIYASQLKKGDVLIAISHSGRTRPVINTVKTAKDRGAQIISITNFPTSVLTKKSDIILQTAAFTKTDSGEVISKRLTALCIIESLYLFYLLSKEEVLKPVLLESDEIVNINKYN